GLGGRRKAAPFAPEQRKTQALFKVLDRGADGRLGHMQQVGGSGDLAGHHHGVKRLQVAQLDAGKDTKVLAPSTGLMAGVIYLIGANVSPLPRMPAHCAPRPGAAHSELYPGAGMAQTQDTVYRPNQQNLYFPQYPKFDSVQAERWHRRQRLAAVCRVFAKFGYEYGFAGHVTVRDPEHPDLFWTNPFAMDFGRVRASDIQLVDRAGTVLEGRWAVNRAGFVLHSAIHEANPDIIASCHAHTTHGMAWAALGRPLDPITQTACG